MAAVAVVGDGVVDAAVEPDVVQQWVVDQVVTVLDLFDHDSELVFLDAQHHIRHRADVVGSVDLADDDAAPVLG